MGRSFTSRHPTRQSTITVVASVEQLTDQTSAYFRRGIEGADNTRIAYISDLQQLRKWLLQERLDDLPIPPTSLARYLSDQANTYKWGTVIRRLAAVRKWHRLNGYPDPSLDETVRIVLEGIKRSIGTEPTQAPAFDIQEFKEQVRSIPPTPTGMRDRALLLVGFAGAFRRSELILMNIEGIQFTRQGAVLSYQGSKTNQYGQTEQKALFFSPDPDTCPVRALQDYVSVLERSTGPLFVRIRKGEQVTLDRLSDKQVARTVKLYLGDGYSAHSLRASFVTVAKLAGADDSEIMQQTKHRTRTMIDRYTRVQQVVKHNAAIKLGL